MLLISGVTIINRILIAVSGNNNAVAVSTSGWRVVMIATVPTMAVGELPAP